MVFKRFLFGTKGQRCAQREYCPNDYTTTSSCLNPWYKKGWTYTSVLFTLNSGPTIWMSQQKLRLTRSVTIFTIFYFQFWWACVNCSLSFPKGVAPGVVFCYCSQSASGLDIWVQKCSRAYLVGVGLCGLARCCLPVGSGQSGHLTYYWYCIIKAFSLTKLPLNEYFLFFWPFFINFIYDCVWKIPADLQFLKYSD